MWKKSSRRHVTLLQGVSCLNDNKSITSREERKAKKSFEARKFDPVYQGKCTLYVQNTVDLS